MYPSEDGSIVVGQNKDPLKVRDKQPGFTRLNHSIDRQYDPKQQYVHTRW